MQTFAANPRCCQNRATNTHLRNHVASTCWFKSSGASNPLDLILGLSPSKLFFQVFKSIYFLFGFHFQKMSPKSYKAFVEHFKASFTILFGLSAYWIDARNDSPLFFSQTGDFCFKIVRFYIRIQFLFNFRGHISHDTDSRVPNQICTPESGW